MGLFYSNQGVLSNHTLVLVLSKQEYLHMGIGYVSRKTIYWSTSSYQKLSFSARPKGLTHYIGMKYMYRSFHSLGIMCYNLLYLYVTTRFLYINSHVPLVQALRPLTIG